MKEGICKYITKPMCVLNTLNLEGCHIGNMGFKLLAQSLKSNTSIISLNLSNNVITSVEQAS